MPRCQAQERANKIFLALDINGDGSLDEEEFCKYIMWKGHV